MVFETRKQSLAWTEHGLQISLKNTHYRWKIKWRLELLGTLRIMGETAFSTPLSSYHRLVPCPEPVKVQIYRVPFKDYEKHCYDITELRGTGESRFVLTFKVLKVFKVQSS